MKVIIPNRTARQKCAVLRLKNFVLHTAPVFGRKYFFLNIFSLLQLYIELNEPEGSENGIFSSIVALERSPANRVHNEMAWTSCATKAVLPSTEVVILGTRSGGVAAYAIPPDKVCSLRVVHHSVQIISDIQQVGKMFIRINYKEQLGNQVHIV